MRMRSGRRRVAAFSQELGTGSIGRQAMQFAAQHPVVARRSHLHPHAGQHPEGRRQPDATARAPLQRYTGCVAWAARPRGAGQYDGPDRASALRLMTLAYIAALDGKLTGGGPAPGPARSALMATGWKPYSAVVKNADGSTTFVPLGNYDPFGLPLGIAADLADILQVYPEGHEGVTGLMTASAVALTNNITNRTYLTGLQRALEAVNDPDRRHGKLRPADGRNLHALLLRSAGVWRRPVHASDALNARRVSRWAARRQPGAPAGLRCLG